MEKQKRVPTRELTHKVGTLMALATNQAPTDLPDEEREGSLEKAVALFGSDEGKNAMRIYAGLQRRYAAAPWN